MKIAIIGAGISGLTLAKLLTGYGDQNSGLNFQITVFEKSKSVGGRIATRRTDEARFDHGAQFYSLKHEITQLHEFFVARGIVKHWFEQNGVARFCAPGGLNQIAKELKADLLSREVTFAFDERIEDLRSEKLKAFDIVVLTPPLPQSLDILIKSGMAYPKAWDQFLYAKACVGLYECENSLQSLPLHGYLDQRDSSHLEEFGIFSISDQKAKNVSAKLAYTVVMDPQFSEMHFEKQDSEILMLISEAVTRFDSKFCPELHLTQLKKWRYSHPTQSLPEAYARLSPKVYLAGDAFGSASIAGAVNSAQALASAITAEFK